MSYTALYRKFRPAEFEDVKGQEHIVTTLQNQIKANRIGHAYLFCGTRGTGKTTVAKIFAKAVNCEHPVNGSPCGKCAMCKSIAAGTSMNVIEIDAASNNGVDNIREIREEVTYRPTEGKYKVYIIDEVHMLSIGAFNALLKTLEEPPEYVIFILATTEVHKIPITILSRCQHYDFKRISIETITARMQELMDTEQIEVEDKALRYIAKAADGSMRDALSLLDQCIAFYLGQKLTYDHVLEVLGAVDTDVFSKLLRNVIGRNVAAVLDIVEELVMQGRELTQLVGDFTWYLRNLLLVKTSDNIEDVLDVSTENMMQLKEESDMIELDMLLRKHGFSRRSFFRYWQRIHSVGPADYIRELRVRHAAELLIETSLPVNSIAMRVNLRNFCYFSRLFRRYYGVTPLQYRRSHWQEDRRKSGLADMGDNQFF